MPENTPAIRPEVVSLLASLNLSSDEPRTWCHPDGRDLTSAEYDIVLSATPPELEAVIDYKKRARDYYAEPLVAVTKVADHIARHFAIEDVSYDLRNNEHSPRMAEFTPAVTAQELIEALDYGLEVAEAIPSDTPILISQYPTVIGQDGEEEYVDLDELTSADDTDEQINAVLVLIAEHVALKKAAHGALLRAIALRERLDLY